MPTPQGPLHVITGATGFVGSAIVVELLNRSTADIVGIVRAADDAEATNRLRQVLHPLVEGYGLERSLHDAIERRVTAVAGDISAPLSGVSPERLVGNRTGGIEFWHCAASLKFQDRHGAEIDRTNIDGTGNVLGLAQVAGCRRFNAVSTAYVAGARSGPIPAAVAKVGGQNNRYEASKIAAEQLVLASALPARILRPGIVIGHSVTRHCTSGDGMYGLLRSLVKYRRALDRAHQGLGAEHRTELVADPGGSLGLVPIDHVAADAVGLSLADADPGFYHLTNPTPPLVGAALTLGFAVTGLARPRFVADPDTLNSIDRKLHQRLEFYSSYLVNPKTFDRSSVEAVLGSAVSPGAALTSAELRAMTRWYLEANFDDAYHHEDDRSSCVVGADG